MICIKSIFTPLLNIFFYFIDNFCSIVFRVVDEFIQIWVTYFSSLYFLIFYNIFIEKLTVFSKFYIFEEVVFFYHKRIPEFSKY